MSDGTTDRHRDIARRSTRGYHEEGCPLRYHPERYDLGCHCGLDDSVLAAIGDAVIPLQVQWKIDRDYHLRLARALGCGNSEGEVLEALEQLGAKLAEAEARAEKAETQSAERLAMLEKVVRELERFGYRPDEYGGGTDASDAVKALGERAEKAEADYQRVIAEVLLCDPISACEREDDALEPPWEVIARVRKERDKAEADVRRLDMIEHLVLDGYVFTCEDYSVDRDARVIQIHTGSSGFEAIRLREAIDAAMREVNDDD